MKDVMQIEGGGGGKYETQDVEWGGYFSLELPSGKEFFPGRGRIDEENIRRYNSGRSAICQAIYDSGVKKIWLPYYMCPSVQEFLERKGIQWSLYHIDYNFLPERLPIQENEMILWVNYYGVMGREKAQIIDEMYHNVIFDNTQAFFAEPFTDAYNIYSCRKFFGVSDGAYLIAKFRQSEELLPVSRTIDSVRFLLESIETSTNDCYKQSLQNERRIAEEDIMMMSKITKKILCSINYEEIRIKRNHNFEVVHNCLGAYNLLQFDSMQNSPMFYPFLIKQTGLRERLVNRKIYIPQLWKSVFEDKNANEWEQFLSSNMIALPIDQRYTEENIMQMLGIILQEMKKI